MGISDRVGNKEKYHYLTFDEAKSTKTWEKMTKGNRHIIGGKSEYTPLPDVRYQ